MLRLTGRPVLVVGGGPVGRRKATTAAGAGGLVTVVDPLPPPADFAGRWVRAGYAPEHLAGVWLAFACGPPAVNARVLADAAARRVWACDAADPAAGGFVLPAVGRAGRITLAVSTGGAAPGLAARLRDELAAHLTPADAVWADLLAELRPLVKALPADRRRVVFAALTEPHWRQRLVEGSVAAVRAEMAALVR
jgi:precorrin-2 dehydrogenase/sirohydrochlorin ferrochelatase